MNAAQERVRADDVFAHHAVAAHASCTTSHRQSRRRDGWRRPAGGERRRIEHQDAEHRGSAALPGRHRAVTALYRPARQTLDTRPASCEEFPVFAAALARCSVCRRHSAPDQTCPPPTLPTTTTTPNLRASLPATSTRRPAVSSRSPCHPNASLFKAPDQAAVQGGQAQLGEILLSQLENEWQIRCRRHPVPGRQLRGIGEACCRRRLLEKKLGERRMMLCSPCRGRRRASTPRSR